MAEFKIPVCVCFLCKKDYILLMGLWVSFGISDGLMLSSNLVFMFMFMQRFYLSVLSKGVVDLRKKKKKGYVMSILLV